MPGHFFAALHPAALPHCATGAASERRVGLVRPARRLAAKAATPRAAGAARLIRRWPRPAVRSCRRSTAGACSLDASRRASWRGSGRSATASWRLGASLRDVPPRSCCAAVAQGPGGEQRQRQRRPGDDCGGGGCLRRSAGAGAAAPRSGVHDWTTRAAAVSSLCSTGVPLQSARGPAAARSHRGAGAQDAEQAQQAGRRIWRLLARPLRQGWLFGRRHQLPWQLRHLLPRCTQRSRSPGNNTNIASFLLKICGGNMRIDAPFCLKTQQYSLEQADGAEHWLR